MVKFYNNGVMKPKAYLFDYILRGEKCQPIILIAYNKCTFSGKNGVQKVWTRKKNIFL